MKVNSVETFGLRKQVVSWFGYAVASTIVIAGLSGCGRVYSNDSDEAYFKTSEAQEAQANAKKWYDALEANTSNVRAAVNQSIPQLSKEELEARALYLLSTINVSQQRSVRTYQNQWYGYYGGTNTYTQGYVPATGGYYNVRTRYNPNIRSQGGTATGGGVVTYNSPSGAGAAGLHVGIAGVCAGAAGGSKVSGAYGGCGGCITWSGDAVSGCF
jgi:hypothetical protein